MKRSDDNNEAINTRIDTFMNTTMPVIEKYKNNHKLKEVNGNQSLEQVTKEIISTLEL